MFDFFKRLFVRKRAYLTGLKPCPCCGGRHILFKPGVHIDYYPGIICDDCGFACIGKSAPDLLNRWDALPRKEESK